MRRALLLVDVINDFMHPNGKNYYPGYETILACIREVLRLAREADWLIVHIRERHRPNHQHDYEFEKLPLHCFDGSWDVEWAEGIQVLPGEYEISKRRYSAFFETDLNLLLREKGIEQVVVVGVKTHVCVRATVQDAFGWGFRPLVIKEAVGSNHNHLHEASLEDIQRYMGQVITLDEFRELISRP
ncbi:isochorismatase family cysteine hydrolase [Thermanaerothrix sp. 4228-RoL]|jgi:nicotinamidase-related amidase|uniref:Isochorismatase family cysteine hydrolase n=1 Tax=Thermanaerothrix solaris TaxID=3058434 RepID=A0ABU3NT92_9CHLR|nr:isochorismatase family cysteine hydrolase [Thermanaerothrix sp. 4228-RoL]MDT8899433.1 isochorismatase family cysteine hydrolase [Thermanaerothrix sp. 4228-RoL]